MFWLTADILFDAVTEDAYLIDPGLVGWDRQADFVEAWEIAWESQVRSHALRGMTVAFVEEDDAQRQRFMEANPTGRGPRLTDLVDTDALAQHYVDGTPLDEEDAQGLAAYREHVKRAKDDGIEGVLEPREMFGEVQRKAQEAEQRYDKTPFSATGHIGGFLGGAVAAVNPRTDPLNFATLPVGGFGKTIAARVATQMGAQGAIEGLNQLTGVQEDRRLLGLAHGFEQGLFQVGAAAVGGAVLQGAGEAVRVGFKRAFSFKQVDQPKTASPAAPDSTIPPEAIPTHSQKQAAHDGSLRAAEDIIEQSSPTAGATRGSVAARQDVADVEAQLNDWGGPRPLDVAPKAAPADQGLPVVAAINKADPKTMRLAQKTVADRAETASAIPSPRGTRAKVARLEEAYATRLELERSSPEGVLKKRVEVEARIAEAGKDLPKDVADLAKIDDLDARVAQLQESARRATGKGKTRRNNQAKRLQAERDAVVEAAAEPVQRAAKASDKARKLTPTVARARARADGRMEATWEDFADARKILRGQSVQPKAKGTIEPKPQPADPLAHTVDTQAKPDDVPGKAQDVAAIKALEREQEALDVSVEDFRAEIGAMDLDATTARFNGIDEELDLNQKIMIENDRGEAIEVTLREYLKQGREEAAELEALTVCRVTSKAA